jgi:hypothetical protein
LTKILAVTSGGGHWDELMMLRDELGHLDITYANTFSGLAEASGINDCHIVADCSREAPISVLKCALDVFRLIRRVRPQVIVSTGAAPGLIAIVIGKIFGCKAIWIDSIANSSELSMSGRLAGSLADVWLTQWKHLAAPRGPRYWGSVI